MTAGRTSRALTVLLAALIGIGTLLLAAPASGAVQSEDAAAPVRIVIDSLTPAIPTAGDVLRIRGRIISTAKTPLTGVSVQLRRSSFPVATRDAVGVAFDAPVTPADGEPADVPLPGTRVAVADEVAPGSRQSFSMEIDVDSLGFTSPGAYVVGVDVVGRESGVSIERRLGVIRTFVPWFPKGSDVAPIDLVWLWPLADWPARTADGVLLTNQTPTELSPDGRLDGLLALGERFRTTVSWISDPALLQTADAMSRGYQVQQGGTTVVGDREQQAKRWLERLSDATEGRGMRALPYADVDASAVTRGGMSNDVVRAVTQGPGIAAAALGRSVPGDLYWAPFGRIDRPTLNVLASSGVTTLILSADAMPATDEAMSTDGLATAALPTSVGSIRAVLTDPGLTATLSLPQRSASDVVLARQRFLAETAVAAQTLPVDRAGRTFVVAPASVRWAPTASLITPLLRATESAPWLAPRTLADLLDAPAPSASRQRGGYGERARESELDADYVARIARTSEALDVFTSVIDDPTGISEPFTEALLRSESAGWRTEPELGERLLTSVADGIADQTDQVRVLSEGTVTFSGDTGKVPVTITNDLDRSVTVGLALRGNPQVRLTSEPLTGIRIEPGRMASVDIEARVVGGDPLAVDVQLLTPDGVDYGKPAPITLASTAYARAASWVVIAAFVAIVVFVVVGVTRRIRKAHAARTAPDLER